MQLSVIAFFTHSSQHTFGRRKGLRYEHTGTGEGCHLCSHPAAQWQNQNLISPFTYQRLEDSGKRAQIMEGFMIFRTLSKLSLSPLIKASQEMGMFFTKHWFTCGNSLENYVSQSPPLRCLVFSRQLFLQLNLPICSICTILCFLFPDIKPQKKHMWLQRR